MNWFCLVTLCGNAVEFSAVNLEQLRTWSSLNQAPTSVNSTDDICICKEPCRSQTLTNAKYVTASQLIALYGLSRSDAVDTTSVTSFTMTIHN